MPMNRIGGWFDKNVSGGGVWNRANVNSMKEIIFSMVGKMQERDSLIRVTLLQQVGSSK